MLGLAEMCAAESFVTIGDCDLRLTPISLGDYAAIELEMLGEQRADRGSDAPAAELLARWATTAKGMAFLVWRMTRRHHVELDRAKCTRLVAEHPDKHQLREQLAGLMGLPTKKALQARPGRWKSRNRAA